MDHNKIVIIGCGASGGTAAQFARKTDRTAEIIIFEKGSYAQYSKCGLPYVISGEIPTFQQLIEFSKEWFEKNHINIFLDTTVEDIDVNKQMITAIHGKDKIIQPYDRLIIATGARPVIPPIKNITHHNELYRNIYTMKDIHDVNAIESSVKKGGKAIVVGAGLIGLELGDALHKKEMNVSIIEALPTILPNTLDPDMGEDIHKAINEHITLLTNHLAVQAHGNDSTIDHIVIQDIQTKHETQVECDIVIVTTGIKPEINLARDIGCSLGRSGGIIVNEHCETSVKNIYAIGDCTEYTDFVTTQPFLVGLGSIAVRQGIAAGTNAAGGRYTLPKGFLNTRTSSFFNIEIAAVGPVQHQCKNIPMVYGKFKGSTLCSYYPGGEPITMKVGIHEHTGTILSAQAVGPNASQRINTMACAILNSMTAEEFRKIETAYAPQIAPTLDVLTVVCDIAEAKRQRKTR